MRTVLIVSPHFPPINAPDMQRVRMSLPHFTACGWRPIVLAVGPGYVEEGVHEPLLLDTLPADVPVRRVAAVPVQWTRKLGAGNLALRALPFLYRAGLDLIRTQGVDLVYFSTALFATMTLGPLWKIRSGIPFVVDMQDPWVNEYQPALRSRRGGVKHRWARRLHEAGERWTMRSVDGLLAVSGDYVDTLRRRYRRLAAVPAHVVAFGASASDFDVLRRHPRANRFFRPGDGDLHAVYAGRGGDDMAPALRIIFHALRYGLAMAPEWFGRVRLHFVGTDYAPVAQSRETVAPLAHAVGVAAHVLEHAQRIPYFDALQLLLDADLLVVPGSDDPSYTASKIGAYVQAGKPLLAVVHERSPLAAAVRDQAAAFVAFDPAEPAERNAKVLCRQWLTLLQSPAGAIRPAPDSAESAAEGTRRQCELFDRVLAETRARRAGRASAPAAPAIADCDAVAPKA